MKSNGTLSGVLHVLLHMAESPRPVTSEVLARAMRTNPVVVRRTMAGLREAGLVRSEKGHGGGWSIARPLDSITLLDIYRGIGAPGLFALGHRSENPHCLVEKAVNHALDDAFDAAQSQLLDRFGAVTLAALSADFHAGMVAAGHTIDQEHAHD